jgi:hypothetical protein
MNIYMDMDIAMDTDTHLFCTPALALALALCLSSLLVLIFFIVQLLNDRIERSMEGSRSRSLKGLFTI